MKLQLKDFQLAAVDQLFNRVCLSRNELLTPASQPQAIVLSSPTGSGKTAIITALMERIVTGDDATPGDPDATFLWISDSPELNEQSRLKITFASSVFNFFALEPIESTFKQDRFSPGKIYFLNTQKLGKDKNLVTVGDKRTYTIWDTINSTAKARPQSFYVIIDEAHRGTAQQTADRERAATIVQRFIKGDTDTIAPARLLIGLSATPQRFLSLLDTTERAIRHVDVAPGDVRDSGLLKDRVILHHPKEKQPSDYTLLEEAARNWVEYSKSWTTYCKTQGIDDIKPILVVQVENATDKSLTATDLPAAIQIVERAADHVFTNGELAHCFDEEGNISVGGRTLVRLNASDIQHHPEVKVVFFKMSLTTGWDCPRAEVMMSFRPAKDATSISQLVGRMVRTPLARRIEGDDILNSVRLYLPHYDAKSLKKIVERLTDAESDDYLAINVEDAAEIEDLVRREKADDLFEALEALPTYTVERSFRSSDARRLVKLCRQLAFDKLDLDAPSRAKEVVLKALTEEVNRLAKTPDFTAAVQAKGYITLRAMAIAQGKAQQQEADQKIRVTPENIDDLFAVCGRTLGEGLHMAYWRARAADGITDLHAKTELFVLLQNQEAWDNLEASCLTELGAIFDTHQGTIKDLPAARREIYRRIRQVAKEPEAIEAEYPGRITWKKGDEAYKLHMYVDDDGLCHAKLNGWERQLLQREMEQTEFVSWMRNVPQRDWSLCVPYRKDGTFKSFYPDFLVLRKVKSKLRVDILEPHAPAYADSWQKALGLAEYASKHGDKFGRIELITIEGEQIRRLDLNKESVRTGVLKITSDAHLRVIFESAPVA